MAQKKGFAHESTYNESKEWYTPKHIFEAMGLHFDMDVCSPGKDIVPWISADKHITPIDNGLRINWTGTVWMNPPYGMDTPSWMKRLKEHHNGIGLVFARTDTNWFHNYAVFADAILFIARRVQFIKAEQAMAYIKGAIIRNNGCGAGSMLIAYGNRSLIALREAESKGLGKVFVPELPPGLPCSVSKRIETVRQEDGSGVIGNRFTDLSHENSPDHVEPEQGVLF